MTTLLIVVLLVAALSLAAYYINEKNEKKQELEAERAQAKLAPEKIEPPVLIEKEVATKKTTKKAVKVKTDAPKKVVKKTKEK